MLPIILSTFKLYIIFVILYIKHFNVAIIVLLQSARCTQLYLHVCTKSHALKYVYVNIYLFSFFFVYFVSIILNFVLVLPYFQLEK